MARLTFQEELCKGCGLCVNACPKHLLALSRTRLNQKGHTPVELTWKVSTRNEIVPTASAIWKYSWTQKPLPS